MSRVKTWRLEGRREFLEAWEAFLCHYDSPAFNTEVNWKIFLTGYLAGGNDMARCKPDGRRIMTAEEFYGEFKAAIRHLDEWPGEKISVYLSGDSFIMELDGRIASFTVGSKSPSVK